MCWVFGSIRIVTIAGEPWFVSKDIAEALDYGKPTDAVRKRVDDEDRGIFKMETPSGIQNIPVINEPGLYSLILSSKLPNAKKFKHWVCLFKENIELLTCCLQKALNT